LAFQEIHKDRHGSVWTKTIDWQILIQMRSLGT